MIEDITPPGSVVPIILDDTPQEPVSDPLAVVDEVRQRALEKIAASQVLTEEEMAALGVTT